MSNIQRNPAHNTPGARALAKAKLQVEAKGHDPCPLSSYIQTGPRVTTYAYACSEDWAGAGDQRRPAVEVLIPFEEVNE